MEAFVNWFSCDSEDLECCLAGGVRIIAVLFVDSLRLKAVGECSVENKWVIFLLMKSVPSQLVVTVIYRWSACSWIKISLYVAEFQWHWKEWKIKYCSFWKFIAWKFVWWLWSLWAYTSDSASFPLLSYNFSMSLLWHLLTTFYQEYYTYQKVIYKMYFVQWSYACITMETMIHIDFWNQPNVYGIDWTINYLTLFYKKT